MSFVGFMKVANQIKKFVNINRQPHKVEIESKYSLELLKLRFAIKWGEIQNLNPRFKQEEINYDPLHLFKKQLAIDYSPEALEGLRNKLAVLSEFYEFQLV